MYKKQKSKNIYFILLPLSCVLLFWACKTSSQKKIIQPVTDFDINEYLGEWYEIARFDFRWEKDIKNVRANYSLNKNGSIKVVNSGYNYKKNTYKKSVGKARVKSDEQAAALQVSFFEPFYSDYTIIAIDSEYQYSLVAGKNTKYLWFLSRTPDMPEEIKNEYIKIAESYGYDLSTLIWTVQE